MPSSWSVGKDGLSFIAVGSLLTPVVVSLTLLLRRGRGAAPLAVSLAAFLLFAPRILQFDTTKGLISDSGLAPLQLEQAARTSHLVLILFSATMALALTLASRGKWTDVRESRLIYAPSSPAAYVRVRVALAICVVASLGSIIDGLRLGLPRETSARKLSALPSRLSPRGPGGRLMARRTTPVEPVVLALSMFGPFLIGGRQSVLTPLLYLFFAVLAVRRREQRGPGWHHARSSA